jgi:hypothetical protein
MLCTPAFWNCPIFREIKKDFLEKDTIDGKAQKVHLKIYSSVHTITK